MFPLSIAHRRMLSRLFLGIFLFAVILCALKLSFNRMFDHDEFEAVHTAWKMMSGERIYVDFFQNHHPLFYYVLMPFLAVFKQSVASVLAIRVVIFAGFLLILFLTCRVSRAAYGEGHPGVMALVVLASAIIFVHKAIEIRPDVFQVAFGLGSVLLLVRFLATRSRAALIVSALCLGVSFLFLQKSVFLLGLIGAVLLWDDLKEKKGPSALAVFAAVFAATLLPYIVYLLATGTVKEYYLCNWFINIKFVYYVPVLPRIALSVQQNPLLWAGWACAFITARKTYHQKVLLFLSAGLLLSVFLMKAPYDQYYMMAIPLMAVASASGIQALFGNRPGLAALCVVLLSLAPVVSLYRAGDVTHRDQRACIEYVLSVTGPDDYVYDGDIRFNLFRKDLDYFWFSTHRDGGGLRTYRQYYPYRYDVYEQIARYMPRVLSTFQIEPGHPAIAGSYAPGKFGLLLRTDR